VTVQARPGPPPPTRTARMARTQSRWR
jgi:hypothetical protein